MFCIITIFCGGDAIFTHFLTLYSQKSCSPAQRGEMCISKHGNGSQQPTMCCYWGVQGMSALSFKCLEGVWWDHSEVSERGQAIAFLYQFEKKKDLDVMITEQNSLLVSLPSTDSALDSQRMWLSCGYVRAILNSFQIPVCSHCDFWQKK